MFKSFKGISFSVICTHVVQMSREGCVWYSPICYVPSILLACFLVPSVQGVVGVSREGGWDTPRRVAWSISREAPPTLLPHFCTDLHHHLHCPSHLSRICPQSLQKQPFLHITRALDNSPDTCAICRISLINTHKS